MTASDPRKLRMRKILFAGVLALAALVIVLAARENRTWNIPEEAKQMKNPLQPSPAALQAARELYPENCAQCHGATGKGDGPEAHLHDPLPSDLSDRPHAAAVTDGELFYRISEGRKPMPAFKKRLTEDQRWQLVLLIRSFSPPQNSPQQPTPVNKP